MHFNPNTTAILVTDPEVDYCHVEGECSTGVLDWDVSNLHQIVEQIGAFIDRVKSHYDVIILQNEESPDTYPDNMPFDEETFVPLCVKGTPGHDLHPAINPEGCRIIQKNNPSGFARKRGGPLSELEQYLLDREKVDILHAGVFAGRCSNATILGAHGAGFKNHILTDLTGNPLGDKMQLEEKVTRALWKSHYAMSMIHSSDFQITA